jgi:hypothetical protein
MSEEKLKAAIKRCSERMIKLILLDAPNLVVKNEANLLVSLIEELERLENPTEEAFNE